MASQRCILAHIAQIKEQTLTKYTHARSSVPRMTKLEASVIHCYKMQFHFLCLRGHRIGLILPTLSP